MDRLYRLLPVFFLLAIAVLLLFPLAALGTRFGLWHFMTAFALLGGGAITGLVLLAICGLILLVAIHHHEDKPKHRAMLVVMTLLLPLGYLAFYAVQASQVPMIHDISTDPAQPPELMALLAQRGPGANPLDYSAEVAAAQASAYPDIRPLHLDLTPAEALARAEQVAQALGWQVVATDAARGTLEATATSFWFGFVDDVVVRIRGEGERTRIDVRSVSRVGKGDVGKNAARIRAFQRQMAE
ncbi:MAG: DUF1499 domain-containing protein [Gammaproteobacteria bacterium]|nr:DUF1499 domain-containing protein [Gammaproteobacteria bacterium]